MIHGVQVAQKEDGACPAGVVFDHIEVVGDTRVLLDSSKAVYAECPFTLSNSRIHEVGTGVRITGGATIVRNYISANHSIPGSGSHRAGIGLNGGSGNVVTKNTIDCSGTGCSGAMVMYGDFAQVRDVLIEGNLFNTTGSYCTYAGSLESMNYPRSKDVRYLSNFFGRKYSANCGQYGPVYGRDDSASGFVWKDNVWADTGEQIP